MDDMTPEQRLSFFHKRYSAKRLRPGEESYNMFTEEARQEALEEYVIRNERKQKGKHDDGERNQ